jgi:hypothetical protein
VQATGRQVRKYRPTLSTTNPSMSQCFLEKFSPVRVEVRRLRSYKDRCPAPPPRFPVAYSSAPGFVQVIAPRGGWDLRVDLGNRPNLVTI